MSLEVFVRGETETLNNSHGGSRVRAQMIGERAHAKQDIGTGILQNRTNDFLAFWTEMSEFIGQTSVRGRQPRLRPFTSHDLGRIAYRMAACQRISRLVGSVSQRTMEKSRIICCKGLSRPPRALWTAYDATKPYGPIAELADALKQLKRQLLTPQSRRDFVGRPVKLFAEHGEKNDHDRSNDRSQE